MRLEKQLPSFLAFYKTLKLLAMPASHDHEKRTVAAEPHRHRREKKKRPFMPLRKECLLYNHVQS